MKPVHTQSASLTTNIFIEHVQQRKLEGNEYVKVPIISIHLPIISELPSAT